jgi:small subunit ribosomal protein S8
MSFTAAPIHDMLIRIKNAYMARRTEITGVYHSVFKENILKLLKQYGFILDYGVDATNKDKKFISIQLREVKDAVNDIPVITFFSRPSRPWYVGYKQIRPVASGKGIGILSTSEGLMAAHVAKKKKLGGELIAEIY